MCVCVCASILIKIFPTNLASFMLGQDFGKLDEFYMSSPRHKEGLLSQAVAVYVVQHLASANSELISAM